MEVRRIQKEIRELKAEMKAKGYPIRSFMNRHPSVESSRANERLFSLKLDLEKAKRQCQAT